MLYVHVYVDEENIKRVSQGDTFMASFTKDEKYYIELSVNSAAYSIADINPEFNPDGKLVVVMSNKFIAQKYNDILQKESEVKG